MDHSFVPPPVPQKDEKFVPPSPPPQKGVASNFIETDSFQNSKGKKLKWAIPAIICVAFALCVATFYMVHRNANVPGGFAGKALILPESIREIEQEAFRKREDIASVTFPDSVRYIGTLAFSKCTNLTKVTFNDGIEHIATAAFLNTNLTEVTIPNSVRSIGSLAFGRCPNLTKVTIPERFRDRIEYIFNGCDLDSIQFTFY